MDLNELRREIDDLDEKIVALFCCRMEVADQIGAYKREHHMPVLQPQREAEKLDRVEALAGAELGPYVRTLYTDMMGLSRAYQERPLFGLLGRTLGHSYSPRIHALLGGYDYRLYPREPEAVESFLRNGPLSGMNVTMPYKKTVIPFLDELSPVAQRLGAVNTIVRREGNRLVGYNTDYAGFRFLVKKSGLDPKGKKCLVLGTGGASVTVRAVLEEMGAQVVVISRRGENHYGNLHRHRDAAILVNATPVGMYPDTGISPVDLDAFPMLEGVLDVVYNPARTKLILDAEARGIPALGGLWMLVAQARESAEWFLNTTISDEKVEQIHRILQSEMENIVLIGMPGCGKSTTARLLQERLPDRVLVEIDAEIEKAAGKPVAELIAQEGEDAFRAWETRVLAVFGARSGQILSTGGGCVTREENYPLIHQNGRIFWLHRDLESLPTSGRPLSRQTGVAELYRQRRDLYQRFADEQVDSLDVEAILAGMGGPV